MPDSVPSPTLDDVRRALALQPFDARTAWLRMVPRRRPLERPSEMPGQMKLAGVLLLLYPRPGGLAFALTRRTDSVATHKGQISLPGGMTEPGETVRHSALRETCEEVSVCLEEDCLIGQLAPLYLVVSDFEIHPFVGYVDARPDFTPQPVEVAEVMEMPLTRLLDERAKAMERWTLSGMEVDVPFYRLDERPVWGATAAILSEFEWRLRAALGQNVAA